MIDEGACRAGASPRPQRSHCRTRQEKETGHNQRVILHEVTSRNLLSLRCHFSLTQQDYSGALRDASHGDALQKTAEHGCVTVERHSVALS